MPNVMLPLHTIPMLYCRCAPCQCYVAVAHHANHRDAHHGNDMLPSRTTPLYVAVAHRANVMLPMHTMLIYVAVAHHANVMLPLRTMPIAGTSADHANAELPSRTGHANLCCRRTPCRCYVAVAHHAKLCCRYALAMPIAGTSAHHADAMLPSRTMPNYVAVVHHANVMLPLRTHHANRLDECGLMPRQPWNVRESMWRSGGGGQGLEWQGAQEGGGK